jgi:dipeptidase E
MKLYLSSQKLGRHPELLLKLLDYNNMNVAIIANALDDMPIEHRNSRLEKEFNMLKSIGLNPEELDLRKYFGKTKELKKYIETKSLIWIRGGNTFILSRSFQASGFDKVFKKLLIKNKIAFGGYSAALLISGKDLFGAELVDDISSIPNGYPLTKKKLTSLKLFDFYLIPHFESKEKWAINVKSHVNYLRINGKKVITLCDGEVYYSNMEKREIIK